MELVCDKCQRKYGIKDSVWFNHTKAKCICGETINLIDKEPMAHLWGNIFSHSKKFHLPKRYENDERVQYKFDEWGHQIEWHISEQDDDLNNGTISGAEKWLKENNINYCFVRHETCIQHVMFETEDFHDEYEITGHTLYFEKPSDLVYFKLAWR